MPTRKKTTPRARRGKAKAKSPAKAAKDRYVLRLFVAGATTRSQQAVLRVRALCAEELKGRCTLEVIDIYQQPALARANQIVATPTLIISLPIPVRRFIGSLTTVADLLGLIDLGEKGRVVL
jgi:circadian clock protein KaiB